MIDNIWSGWRSGYVSRLDRRSAVESRSTGRDEPSIFRRLLDSGLDDEELFIVHRGSNVFTLMNSFPYSVGHVLVVPFRQVSELEDLRPDESAELWSQVEKAVRVLRSVLAPDGFNIGLNLGAAAGGSVSEHLHVHVVPRWVGDANFTVVTASMKAVPEALDVTAARVRDAWISHENGQQTGRKAGAERETGAASI